MKMRLRLVRNWIVWKALELRGLYLRLDCLRLEMKNERRKRDLAELLSRQPREVQEHYRRHDLEAMLPRLEAVVMDTGTACLTIRKELERLDREGSRTPAGTQKTGGQTKIQPHGASPAATGAPFDRPRV